MAGKSSYNATAYDTFELFADYVAGGPELPALALSERSLAETPRSAIDKSLVALGFGRDACTFATLLPRDAAVEGGDVPLDAQALFLLVESLDPRIVICADAASTTAIGETYRMQLALDQPARVFGRPAVAFADLGALLEDDRGKRTAWELLKTLVQR